MERKTSASLNDIYEDDAYILKHLPEDGVSKIIKAALVLYYRVQTGEVVIANEPAPPEPVPVEPALTAMIEALLDGVGLLVTKADQQLAEATGNTQAIVQAIQAIKIVQSAMPHNGNGNGHHRAPDEERESLDDPLVRNMIGMNFDDAFSES